MKSFLTRIAQVLVGGLFIFSGLVKMNDPVGFSFKLEEYFSEEVLNLPSSNRWHCRLPLFW